MKSAYYKWLVTITFLAGSIFYVQNIYAQKPVIKTSVTKNNILIGEQLHYKVETSMPDNTYRLAWFTMPDTLGHFQVVRQNKIDSQFINGNINFSQDITLTSFDSGRQVIPSLIINMATLQGDSAFNLVTDSIPVNVSFSPLDSVKTFHDIKSIIDVKKQWQWWWWAILAVAVLLLIFWVRFLINFLRKKKAAPDMFNTKLSPYEEAMKSLTELQSQQLIEKQEVKVYHTKLTEIFKRYISRSTKTFKMHLTSDEIMMDLDKYGVAKENIFAFANCLRMSNAVKFAKYIPPQNESEKCLYQTKEMINEIHKNLNKKTESDI